MANSEKFYVIVNPFSGNNRKSEYYQTVLAALQAAYIGHEIVFTEHSLHASALAHTAIESGYQKLIVVSGDGTYNEVIQGVCSTGVDLSSLRFVFVPAGTGNDWHRTMFAGGFDLEKIRRITDDDHYISQDLGVVTYSDGADTKRDFFINVFGVGFDVYVAQKYLNASQKSGPLSYLWATLKGILTYKNIPLVITTSDTTCNANCFMVVAGIGGYFAGGMQVLPEAKPNDGWLSIGLVMDVDKLTLLRSLPKMYKGRKIEHPKVKYLRSMAVTISGSEDVSIEVDGEIRGHLPVRIEIRPQALKVFAPTIN